MSLEERVRVVEQDVTALHRYAQQTHAEREGWYNEFRDARAEARGWGEFAVKANNKVDGMDIRFDRIDARLDAIGGTLEWHGEMLKVHGDHFGKLEAMLQVHDQRFGQLEAMLQVHDQRFDRVDTTLAEHGSLLAEHGSLLREILARLDAPRP